MKRLFSKSRILKLVCLSINLLELKNFKLKIMSLLFRKRLFVFRILLFLYFCFLLLMLLHPDPWTLFGFPPRVVSLVSHFSFLHCLIFAVLSFGTEMLRPKNGSVLFLTFLLLFCFISEILQTYTGRQFEFIDILQNAIGLLSGFCIARNLRHYQWINHFFGYQINIAKPAPEYSK